MLAGILTEKDISDEGICFDRGARTPLAKELNLQLIQYVCISSDTVIGGSKHPNSNVEWAELGNLMRLLHGLQISDKEDQWVSTNSLGVQFSTKSIRDEVDAKALVTRLLSMEHMSSVKGQLSCLEGGVGKASDQSFLSETGHQGVRSEMQQMFALG